MEVKTNQIILLLVVVCFVLLIRNLFLLRFFQPVGYAFNIYSIFPLSFYLTLMFCFLMAIFLVLNGKRELGAIILCLNHFEILTIPYFLGYYSMGRADDMSYIGEYLQIAASGHFASWDIYPDSHIIGAGISLISNLAAHQTSFIIPIVFSFIFIAGIWLFSREIIPDYCIQSLVLVSSFVLYLGAYNFLNVPHALFFSLMPLYLCYFYKYMSVYNDTSHSIIFVLLTLIMPFAHPFIIFFLFVVFLFHLVPKSLLMIPSMGVLRIPRAKISSFLLLSITFMSWLFYNERLSNDFKGSYVGYIDRMTKPLFVEATNSFSKINLGLFDYIQLLSIYYGRYVFPTLIIFISVIYLYYHKDLLEARNLRNYLFLWFLFIIFLFIQLILIFNPIIAHQLDRISNLNFVVYSQIPLFSCALYLLLLKKSKSISKKLLVCIILLFVWSSSLFGCFDSPYIYRPNTALTYNEVYGMNWFYDAKSESSIVAVPLSQINRFHDLFGNPRIRDHLYFFADHFGYLNSSHRNLIDFNPDLVENSYIIIFTIDELLYQEIPAYRYVGRYNKEDFDRLRNDIAVNKIYDDLNIEINKI